MRECLRCGSSAMERGLLMVKGTTGWDIRFQPEQRSWFSLSSLFSFKKQVVAYACTSCGHVELVLTQQAGAERTEATRQNDPGKPPADPGAGIRPGPPP